MEYIKIGKIIKTHGLKGEVKLQVFTENLDDLEKYDKIYIGKNREKSTKIESFKIFKNNPIVKFDIFKDINEAEKEVGEYIYITEKEMSEKNPLSENEFYIKDLIGINVYLKEDLIGQISYIIENSVNDIYVIKVSDVKRIKQNEICIPALKKYIKNIDILNKKMEVDLGDLYEF